MSNEEILCYILRQLPLILPRHYDERPDPYERVLRESLVRAFHHSYRGDAHRRFLNFAVNVNLSLFEARPATEQPYYKGTAVVQSSGTGKIRMILELGRVAPLLYLCIRSSTGTARTGYPLGDTPIMDLIRSGFRLPPPPPSRQQDHPSQSTTIPKSAHKPKSISDDEKAAILLAVWFDIIVSKLEEQSHAKAKFDYLVELNTFGTSDADTKRSQFSRNVAAKAIALGELAPIADNYHAIFNHYLNPRVDRLTCQVRLIRDHLGTIRHVETRRISSLPIFVAIDECVQLPSALLTSIERAWAHLKKLDNQQREERKASKDTQQPTMLCFWLVLLSTNSGPAHLVRSQSEHASARDGNAVPLPTFSGIGFGVLRTELKPLAKAQEVATTPFVQKYGRPLWISLVPENFWSVAISKLLGTASFQRDDRTACFNVLASRLALQYIPTRGSDNSLFDERVTFARMAVDRYMRILDCVDGDAILHISSPSEPVLAIASLLIMMPSHAEEVRDVSVTLQTAVTRYGSILETVADNCLGSANIDILKGVHGELTVRLLLMAA